MMTDEQINQRIAEACAWRKPKDCALNPPYEWQSPIDGCCYNSIPDYCNNLNAMHHMLAKWAPDLGEMRDYLNNMKNLVAPHYLMNEPLLYWCFLNATARQHAEVFLRTIGKWEE